MSAMVKKNPAADIDQQDVIDRINALAVERTALYRKATDGWSPEERARIKAVNENWRRFGCCAARHAPAATTRTRCP